MDIGVLVGLEIEFKGKTYFFAGEYNDRITILTTKIDMVDELLSDLLGTDSSFYTFVQPMIPNEIEFIYTISHESKNSFSLRASFADQLIELRIIKSNNFSMLEIWINQSFAITDLPLVGGFIPDNYLVTGIGYMYLHKNDSNATLNYTDFAHYEFDRLKNKSSDDILIKFNNEHNVFLSYQFDEKKGVLAYPSDTLSLSNPSAQRSELPQTTTQNGNIPSSFEAVNNLNDDKKIFGINKLNLEFNKNKKQLQLNIDAYLNLSNFQFEVVGLKINYSIENLLELISKAVHDSRSIKWREDISDGLSFAIDGLSLNYTTPQLSIYGGFYKQESPTGIAYNGLITFKIKKIAIVALGSYIKENQYASIFGFGYVGAPFGGVPAFELKGIALGFGINRSFELPTISEVESFPLIQVIKNNGLQKNQSLPDFFQKLNTYFQPKKDAYILSLGIRFETFKVMDTIALASITIDRGCQFNMIGVSTLSSVNAYRLIIPFFLTIDLQQGEIIARGELAAGSYILFPEFTLKGSFALGMWLAGEHAGDFVVSLGGYHPNFIPKNHYPSVSQLNRLALDFKKGNLHIYGALYFTLTSQAIMCGVIGQLSYNYHFEVGVNIAGKMIGFKLSVEIMIRLEAHFIISWHPFYYSAELQLLYYVALKANFTLFKVNISVQLAAGLHLWGPEFSVKAYLTVCSYQLAFSFGSISQRSTQLSKAEFVATYIPEPPIQSSMVSGVIKKNSDDLGDEILYVNVNEFVFEVNSKIPLQGIKHKGRNLYLSNTEFDANFKKSDNDDFLISNISVRFINDQNVDLALNQNWEINPLYGNYPKAIWCKNGLTTQSILKEENLIKDCISGAKVSFKNNPSDPTVGQIASLVDQISKNHNVQVVKNINHQSVASTRRHINSLQFQFQQSILDSFPDVIIDYTDLQADILPYTYHSPINHYDII